MKTKLPEAVQSYLETRRRLGFTLTKEGVELRGLVRYAQSLDHRGPLTAQLAIQWARLPHQADRVYWASRLDIARRFAVFWIAYDPQTEIPPRGLFGPPSVVGRYMSIPPSRSASCWRPQPRWAVSIRCVLTPCGRSWACWPAPACASEKRWVWRMRIWIGTRAS